MGKIKIFQNKELILHIDSAIIGLLSLYNSMIFFIIMLIILFYGMILSYNNYQKIRQENKRNKFAQFYFIVIVLAFIGYLTNFLVGFFETIQIYINILTIAIFLTILAGTFKLSKNNNK